MLYTCILLRLLHVLVLVWCRSSGMPGRDSGRARRRTHADRVCTRIVNTWIHLGMTHMYVYIYIYMFMYAYLCVYIHIYIYIYIYREREREIHISLYMYIQRERELHVYKLVMFVRAAQVRAQDDRAQALFVGVSNVSIGSLMWSENCSLIIEMRN